jgi:glyoxylase-like metal-dependent hydrolase (beta-lactamase superfamily II)/rhodanese-related sulfurtransferase
VLDMVVETHLHNDHVSGGPELAEITGATYAISAHEEVEGARGLVDGERFAIGTLSVEVVGTPGHTKHHQSFVVTEDEDCVVFTGGSLLIGTVGRTDLLGAEHAAALAAQQWTSVRRLLKELPGSATVHPTHGFGSFCSATPCVGTETTIEAERRVNAAAQLDRRAFVTALLGGFGEYPRYFSHIAARNRAADRHASYRHPVPTLAPSALAELATRVWVVDVRSRSKFAAAHVPGTINMGVDGPFATYLGWTMPWGSDFALVGADEAELTQARTALAHIGLDLPVGTAVAPAEVQTDSLRRVTFAELAARWTGDISVIDVRRREEWDAGHLKGAHHVPVHRLMDEDADLPSGPLWLYCAAGYRAVLGASLLRRSGREVVAIDDAWRGAKASGLSISTAHGFEHRRAS